MSEEKAHLRSLSESVDDSKAAGKALFL